MNNNKLSYFIIRRTVVYSLFVIGVFLVGFKKPKPLALGYIFGTCIGILGFKLLELTINRALTMVPEKAFYYALSQYFIRYIIYGIILTIATLTDCLSLSTTVIGLFMIKIVILTNAIFENILKRKSKEGKIINYK